MRRTIYRYEVPIDDDVHEVALESDPVHVAVKWDYPAPPVMEFWAEAGVRENAEYRYFVIHGTGHQVHERGVYRGTADRVNGLVFHLYEVV